MVSFSRNFGHEAAMIAGINYADGDGIVCMDADLQHPPECLPEIVRKFEEGCWVISMVRTKNKSAGHDQEHHLRRIFTGSSIPCPM
ncbi:MAG: glycosyltransferase [Clostridium sp.]